jgi:signal transduction histidine kinase
MVSTLNIEKVTNSDIADMKMCIDHIRDILAKFGDFSIKRDGDSFVLKTLFQCLEILHRPFLKNAKIEMEIEYLDISKDEIVQHNFHEVLYMLNNMIINSITAIEQSIFKKIKITVQRKDNNKIRLNVMDTGCGIPKENLSKIFEPYFSTKDNGTGVGLTHVKYVMDNLLNGEITYTGEIRDEFITIFELIIPIKIERNESKNFDN